MVGVGWSVSGGEGGAGCGGVGERTPLALLTRAAAERPVSRVAGHRGTRCGPGFRPVGGLSADCRGTVGDVARCVVGLAVVCRATGHGQFAGQFVTCADRPDRPIRHPPVSGVSACSWRPPAGVGGGEARPRGGGPGPSVEPVVVRVRCR